MAGAAAGAGAVVDIGVDVDIGAVAAGTVTDGADAVGADVVGTMTAIAVVTAIVAEMAADTPTAATTQA
jgi:hypothetical protein